MRNTMLALIAVTAIGTYSVSSEACGGHRHAGCGGSRVVHSAPVVRVPAYSSSCGRSYGSSYSRPYTAGGLVQTTISVDGHVVFSGLAPEGASAQELLGRSGYLNSSTGFIGSSSYSPINYGSSSFSSGLPSSASTPVMGTSPRALIPGGLNTTPTAPTTIRPLFGAPLNEGENNRSPNAPR